MDSATSLIQAAKNLMNAVVLTVKASYVASTKYPRQGTVAVSLFVNFLLFKRIKIYICYCSLGKLTASKFENVFSSKIS